MGLKKIITSLINNLLLVPFLKPGPRLKQCEEKISETRVRPQGRAGEVEPLGPWAGEQEEEDGKGHIVDGVHFAFTRLSLVKAESSKWPVPKCSPFQLQSNHCDLIFALSIIRYLKII